MNPVSSTARRPLSRRRWLANAAWTGGAAALVTACGASQEAPAKVAGPVTVTYVSHLAETHPEGRGYHELLEEYTRTNQESITVRLEEAKAATGYDKMLALSAAGTPPDLARIDSTRPASLFVPGATIDMEEALKRDKDWAKQKADMFPGHLENQVWNGKLMSIATYQSAFGVIYSPKLLTRAGLAAPKQGWTWNDFREAALKAGAPPTTWGLSLRWGPGHLQTWIGSAGSTLVSADKRKMQVNTPEAQEALEFVVGLIKSSITSPTNNPELFQKGTDEAVFEQNGSFRMPTYRTNGIRDFGVVHHPLHPTKKVYAAYADGSEVVVFKGLPPERQTAAGRVALWLNGPSAQARQCVKVTMLPVSKAAANSAALQEHLKTDPQHKAFVDIAAQGRSIRFPSLPSYARIVNEAITPGYMDILSQKVGVREGLITMQGLTQAILDEDLKPR